MAYNHRSQCVQWLYRAGWVIRHVTLLSHCNCCYYGLCFMQSTLTQLVTTRHALTCTYYRSSRMDSVWFLTLIFAFCCRFLLSFSCSCAAETAAESVFWAHVYVRRQRCDHSICQTRCWEQVRHCDVTQVSYLHEILSTRRCKYGGNVWTVLFILLVTNDRPREYVG